MIIIADREALLASPHLPLPADLRPLVVELIAHCLAADLLDLTYVIIAEAGDTERAIAEEIGFAPTTNPTDALPWNSPGFTPYWAHLRRRGAWYELTHCISNDGFAFVLYINDAGDSDLVRMCDHFTTVPL